MGSSIKKTENSNNSYKRLNKNKSIKLNRVLWYSLFVLPIFTIFILVVIVPSLYGFLYSFYDWNGIKGLGEIEFIGFKNYISAFTESDKSFLKSFLFSIEFTILSVAMINLVGFGLALLVTRGFKGSNVFRTIFFMPNLIGGLILGFIWQFIFVNVFNFIGKELGISLLQGWLGSQLTGLIGLVILLTWQMAGYIMIIYIAAIQNIPSELIEAADVDGASVMQKIRHIIFPMVAPAFTISLFLTLSNSFKLFDQNLSLTNGGPYRSTELLALNIYKTAFTFNRYGVAQAKAIVFFIFVSLITLSQVYFTKKREVEM